MQKRFKMKWKVLFSMLLASMCHLEAAANTLQTTGSFFREITDNPASEKKQRTTKVIKNPYYQCDLDENCNFILQNLKAQNVKKIESKMDLPSDRADLYIWEKDKRGMF